VESPLPPPIATTLSPSFNSTSKCLDLPGDVGGEKTTAEKS